MLQELIQRNKLGCHCGFYSCCSANEDVLRAVLLKARQTGSPALIESTSNQVNQYGGYSGKTPQQFAEMVRALAHEQELPADAVYLGGDHIGYLPWVHLSEDEAMAQAAELVRACVQAGYAKLHIDTSMRCASDAEDQPFSTETSARRAATLASVAEQAFAEYRARNPQAEEPIYVIGSEVPVPGGDFKATVTGVTAAEDALRAIELYQQAFAAAGVGPAFLRVVALVVETGVDFHRFTIDEYDRTKTAALTAAVRGSELCIEGHSSDYQTAANLRRMCEDGIAILKVGPALTHRLRESLFALELIEREVYREQPGLLSNFRQVLDQVMLANPAAWQDYYPGSEQEQSLARAFSYYDRSRYYLTDPAVLAARQRLIDNLSGNRIPHCLLSQFLPIQSLKVRSGLIRNEAADIVFSCIGDQIDDYLEATLYNGARA
ncbi:MAG: class II D-tagatose-bisphosphate aldolase, non-catalytic subunit [Coriobacteriales bacterium]|nr:class II D-tagatose-bisphosphate aldolase, non-catalytic subunit [Coriobacteriales bacterium]